MALWGVIVWECVGVIAWVKVGVWVRLRGCGWVCGLIECGCWVVDCVGVTWGVGGLWGCKWRFSCMCVSCIHVEFCSNFLRVCLPFLQ